jgi:transposase-like protein
MSHRIRYTDEFKQDAVAQVVARCCAPRVNLRVG